MNIVAQADAFYENDIKYTKGFLLILQYKKCMAVYKFIYKKINQWILSKLIRLSLHLNAQKNYNNQSIYRIDKNDKRNPKKYDITISVTLLLA